MAEENEHELVRRSLTEIAEAFRSGAAWLVPESDTPGTGENLLPSRVDDALLVGEHDHLHAVAQPELAQRAGDVCLDRRLGDKQRCGDLGVAQPGGDVLQYFVLPLGQVVQPGVARGGWVAGVWDEGVEQVPGDPRRDDGIPRWRSPGSRPSAQPAGRP